MNNMKRVSSIIFAVGLLFLACSSGEDIPNMPSILLDGRISVFNHTGYPIRLFDFTHQRWSDEHQLVLNVRVYPNSTYRLRNLIDEGDTDIFPGGDHVWIKFVSDVSDPENPDRPLFENTANLIVNGNNTISVKSGGEYSIGPG